MNYFISEGYGSFGRIARKYQRKRATRNVLVGALGAACLLTLLRSGSQPSDEDLPHISPSDHFRYCIQYNFTRSYNNFRVDAEFEPVTLAIHTSIDFLHNMFEQVETWDGAISLSVFIERDVSEFLSYIYRIHDCDEDVRRQVSFHIVTIFDQLCDPIVIQRTWDCSLYLREDTISYLRSIQRSGFIYPINVMRNVARRGAQSKIHILTDIEMIFSLDAERLLTRVANKLVNGHKKIVLVIRRFEVEEGLEIPRTVEQLYEMFSTNKSVVEFHAKLFPEGHLIPYIHSWFDESLNSTKIHARGVPYSNSFWEPQVVIHAYDPMHDETIPTRHRDHQALIYELCRAGYRFFVVTKIFNVHRGIKRSSTFLDKEVARLGQEANLLRSRIFFRRMNLLYPTTYLKCARWDNRKVSGRPRPTTNYGELQNEYGF